MKRLINSSRLRRVSLWLIIGLITTLGFGQAPETNPRLRQDFGGQAYQQLYEDLLYPSVRITACLRADTHRQAGVSIGSGVVISHRRDAEDAENTYILTAAHVVGNESMVTATFYSCHEDYPTLFPSFAVPKLRSGGQHSYGVATDSTKTPSPLCLSAFVAITDTAKDLALLKLNPSNPHNLRFHTAKLAPRDYTPYIFTPVYAVGCSLGLDPRPSEGIITTVGRHPERSEGSRNNRDSSPVRAQNDSPQYWEMSAPIVPGNSGGGVFLADTHELIGIAVWVKVYRQQLITTMAGIVPLQNIYEFLKESPEGVRLRRTR